MPTNCLHLVINGRCSWCQGPHVPPPLTLTIDDLTHTRIHQTKQSMRWPRDEETTERLRKLTVSAKEELPWIRRLFRWLTRT